MFLQTLTTKRVKTRDSFGFGVGIETNRASNLLLEVFQKRLHHDRQKLGLLRNTQLLRDIISDFRENRTKSVTLTACGQSRSMTFFVTLDEGGVGFCGFGHFLDRFFGFCTEKLRFFGFGVCCGLRFFRF